MFDVAAQLVTQVYYVTPAAFCRTFRLAVVS